MGSLRSYEPGMPVWIDYETTAGTTAASRFYCGLFGWRVLARHRPIDDYLGYWIFQQNGMDIGGLAPGRQAAWTVYMGVSDVDETTQVVVENGGTVLEWPLTVFDAGRLAVFADPLGARFAVWEPAAHTGADLVDEPNSFTRSELTCHDTDTAMEFYNKVFHWEAATSPRADDPTHTAFSLPGGDRSIAGMVRVNGSAHDDVAPRWMTYFAVADTDGTAARVAELGGRVVVAPLDRPGVGRVAVVADAEGAVFSVLQTD